jgi:hypothetical protein
MRTSNIKCSLSLSRFFSLRHSGVFQGRRIDLYQRGIGSNPGLARISGREVPLHAYVFEADGPAIL